MAAIVTTGDERPRGHVLGSCTWVELDDPRPDELTAVLDRFGLPAFAVEVGTREAHRPRLAAHDGHLLVVLRTARYVDADEAVETDRLVVVAGPDVVLTIGSGPEPQLTDVRRRLAGLADQDAIGPAEVVLAIAETVVDSYVDVLDGLDTDVDEIETEVFSGVRGSRAERIYRLKREVQELRRATSPLPEEFDRLLRSDAAPHFVALAASFRDVRAKAARAADHVSTLDELLNSALDAHLAQIAVQQNDDMRRISAWVAIVAVPTALAGIYGMNFRTLPGLESRFGYLVVLGAMAAICAVLYRQFRRSGWL